MEERWKAVDGYDGLYEVSNAGRIKSLKKNMVLRGVPDKDGYLKVCLFKSGTKKMFFVHRLVAIAFVDGYSVEKPIINHKNEIKTQNDANNLEWCDVKYNINYNNMPYRRAAALRIPIVATRGSDRIEFISLTEAANVLGVSQSNISRCLKNHCGHLKGYSFDYI